IAPGIRVPAAIGDYLILDAIRDSGGTAVAVSDGEIREGLALAAREEGLFVSPESAAAIIAVRRLRQTGALAADDETVVFSTGSGLMHVDLVEGSFPEIDPNAADLVSEIDRALTAGMA
ncbi:MAG TPA: pyridoxal-phosphate dependent enzyme, partial [Thermomicrobiales bacterium]|nr:pyridoxal-phosphate dependent enzyme [Thermomicrobiales bacterium]